MQGKVLLERSATPVYVGIDVCKARLDVYIHPTGQKLTVSNDRDGLKRLKRVLKTCKAALVVMRRDSSAVGMAWAREEPNSNASKRSGAAS